jgi:hypothetical protein
MQVLFSEQVKMRAAMQEKEPAPSGNISEQEGNQSSTVTEIKNLKAELQVVKTKMAELQSDYSEYEKQKKPKNVSGLSFTWRKIKNSLHARVEGDETGDGQQRPNRFRRRLSVS